METKISIEQHDPIVVFGSGTIAGRCVGLLRTLTLGDIFVFEKKEHDISVLEKHISSVPKVFYRPVNEEIESYVVKIAPKVIFSINNTYIFKKTLVELCPIINFHNSLLPIHPGRNAEAWQIFSQEKVAGVTWHLVNEHVDKGNVIAQKEIKLDSRITAIKLLQKQTMLAYEMFQELAVKLFNVHTLTVHEQKAGDEIKFHFSWERPNNGMLDLSWDAGRMSAFLRAMDYGRLYILGRPHLIYNGKDWTWERYEISCCKDERKINFCWDDRREQATICKDGYLIRLFGMKEI